MNEITLRPSSTVAEIQNPADAELAIRHHLAIVDVMRRARADIRQQAEVLSRVIEFACRGADLIDEMRERGELAQRGDNQHPRSSGKQTLADLGLDDRRLAEWRSLRDNNALGFLRTAIEEEREETLRKASLNWVRERIERIERESATPPDYEPAYDHEVRHGDLRNTLDDLAGQVDAIITDPPYPAQYLDEWDALGEVASRLLTKDGFLIAMAGQAHLPAYLERLQQHLAYRWCSVYLTDGPATRIHGRRVGTKWKPLLVFDRNERRRFITQDVFASMTADKDLSRQLDGWSQSETGMADIIERLTNPGELIVDPFLGAGTTAVVCRQLGRRFVGCDIDQDAIRATRERLNG